MAKGTALGKDLAKTWRGQNPRTLMSENWQGRRGSLTKRGRTVEGKNPTKKFCRKLTK